MWLTAPHILFGGFSRRSDPTSNFLSNFYPCALIINDKLYPHVEAYYQSRKFTTQLELEILFIDPQLSGSVTKRLAKTLAMTHEEKERWESGGDLIAMREGIWEKFKCGGELRNRLVKTGEKVLVEDSGDRKWGAVDGKGRNLLGVLLMERRAELVVMDKR